jgi:hypothetical protein
MRPIHLRPSGLFSVGLRVEYRIPAYPDLLIFWNTSSRYNYFEDSSPEAMRLLR